MRDLDSKISPRSGGLVTTFSATGYKTFLGNYSGAGGGGGTIEGSQHKHSVLKANDSVNLAHYFSNSLNCLT